LEVAKSLEVPTYYDRLLELKKEWDETEFDSEVQRRISKEENGKKVIMIEGQGWKFHHPGRNCAAAHLAIMRAVRSTF